MHSQSIFQRTNRFKNVSHILIESTIAFVTPFSRLQLKVKSPKQIQKDLTRILCRRIGMFVKQEDQFELEYCCLEAEYIANKPTEETVTSIFAFPRFKRRLVPSSSTMTL